MRGRRFSEIPVGIAFASVFWALFVVWLNAPAIFHLFCPDPNQPSDDKCQAYGLVRYLLAVTIRFVNDNAGLFTGLSGIAVAIFTGFLVTLARRQARTTKILERAYISVEPLGLKPWRGTKNLFLAHVSIRNTGNLPARNVSWIMHMDQGANGDRATFPITNKPRGRNVLTSGSAMTRGAKPQNVAPLNVVEWYCYVWGRIDYEDGFGERRFTSFCHRYNLKAATFAKSRTISARDARQHDDGNDAD